MTDAGQQEVVDEAMARLVVVMEDVTDPRGLQGRRHLLPSVLSIAVLVCLCCCDDAEALQDWSEKEDPLCQESPGVEW